MHHQRMLLVFALLTAGAPAQWLNYPTPGIPRTPDGKPNITAPSPRTADGKPDLSGVWHVHPTSLAEMKRIFGDSVLAASIPFAGLVSEPTKLVQSLRLIVFLYESDATHRQIYTDGREFPKEFAQPSWLGYSIGKWEHDTLVVETAGFNDKSWLDLAGHPHSEALRISERYHRRDFVHLDVEMTLDDPQMYTRLSPLSSLRTFGPTPMSSNSSATKMKRISSTPDTIELSDCIEEAVWKP